ncbi:MAG: hypothetical protein ACRCX2_21780 [Paraclostridium sp.]
MRILNFIFGEEKKILLRLEIEYVIRFNCAKVNIYDIKEQFSGKRLDKFHRLSEKELFLREIKVFKTEEIEKVIRVKKGKANSINHILKETLLEVEKDVRENMKCYRGTEFGIKLYDIKLLNKEYILTGNRNYSYENDSKVESYDYYLVEK